MNKRAEIGSKYIIEIKRGEIGDCTIDFNGIIYDIDYNDVEMGKDSRTPVIIGEYKEPEAIASIKWRPTSQLPDDKTNIIIRDKNGFNVVYEEWNNYSTFFKDSDMGWIYVDEIPFSKPESRYRPNSYWKVKINDINHVIKIDHDGKNWIGFNSTDSWTITKNIEFLEEIKFN